MGRKIEYTAPTEGGTVQLQERDVQNSTLEWIMHKNATGETGRFPDAITSAMSSNEALERTIADWRPILTRECQVYVTGEQYIGKRFDQIHYKYMEMSEAKEVLTDNLYAILYYKYFPVLTDKVLDRVTEIVRALTVNLKSFLTKIDIYSPEYSARSTFQLNTLPISAAAFNNGVFDFAKNEWILKYEKINVPMLNQTIILYDKYIILWNFNFDFEPYPFAINDVEFEDFCELMKECDKEHRNYCFELFYNMSHDSMHKDSAKRRLHLAQIFGYLLIPKFLQYFIMFIGSGQNGKNSLFDGCFSAHITPRPASNSLDDIEKDRFITGALCGASHNIFLETSAKVYTDSNMLKALTGGMLQTIQNKGDKKYQGIINCKYVFAGNDQENIKFADTTIGFRRRINLFEIFYSWDSEGRYLRYGDYYKSNFSGDLHELKEDPENAKIFVYLGMYGIKSATENFTKDFKFSGNEWSESYSNLDFDVKDFFDHQVKVEDYFYNWGNLPSLDAERSKRAFYTANGEPERLQSCQFARDNGIFNYTDMIRFMHGSTPETQLNPLNGEEMITQRANALEFLRDNDVYISLYYLNALMEAKTDRKKTAKEFNEVFKKIYPSANYQLCANREPYVKARLSNGRLRFIAK